jgi:2-oxo-4-hydroxy-4-carboxy--5-ureidoimidazoline (OHCU) decarboxylase
VRLRDLPSSYLEQAAAGPAAASVVRELTQLNGEYEAKFGIRFVYFLNGQPLEAAAIALRVSLVRSREQELSRGLAAFLEIARSRLSANPQHGARINSP